CALLTHTYTHSHTHSHTHTHTPERKHTHTHTHTLTHTRLRHTHTLTHTHTHTHTLKENTLTHILFRTETSWGGDSTPSGVEYRTELWVQEATLYACTIRLLHLSGDRH